MKTCMVIESGCRSRCIWRHSERCWLEQNPKSSRYMASTSINCWNFSWR